MKRVIGLKPSTIIEIISALFIVLFLYTALNKSNNITGTVHALQRTQVFIGFETFIAWSVVVAEYIAAIFLIVPRLRKLGLYVSLILMAGFSLYVGFMMIFLSTLPCSCGGVISKMTWKQHLIFNLFFALLAFLAIRMSRIGRNNDRTQEINPVVFT